MVKPLPNHTWFFFARLGVMFVLITYKFYDRISWSKNDKTLFKLEIRKSQDLAKDFGGIKC